MTVQTTDVLLALGANAPTSNAGKKADAYSGNDDAVSFKQAMRESKEASNRNNSERQRRADEQRESHQHPERSSTSEASTHRPASKTANNDSADSSRRQKDSTSTDKETNRAETSTDGGRAAKVDRVNESESVDNSPSLKPASARLEDTDIDLSAIEMGVVTAVTHSDSFVDSLTALPLTGLSMGVGDLAGQGDMRLSSFQVPSDANGLRRFQIDSATAGGKGGEQFASGLRFAMANGGVAEKGVSIASNHSAVSAIPLDGIMTRGGIPSLMGAGPNTFSLNANSNVGLGKNFSFGNMDMPGMKVGKGENMAIAKLGNVLGEMGPSASASLLNSERVTSSLADGLTGVGGLQSTGNASAAGRLSMPASVSFGQPAWAAMVAERAASMALQNIQSAEIQLDPAELGPLNIKVSVQNDQATVAFTSAHVQVREALDQTMVKLREMLAEEGVDLVEANVSDEGSSEADPQAGEEGNEETANSDQKLAEQQRGEEMPASEQDPSIDVNVSYGVDSYV